MASENIEYWIRKNTGFVGDRVLELGSRQYQDHSNLNLRKMFPRVKRFVGTDIQEGEGVDVVCDLRRPFEEVDDVLGGQRFDTVFCISVLEHIDDVFTASKNIVRLLDQGGTVFLSVPFVFRHHGYPSDFWRFTPEALRFLFPTLDFDNELRERAWISTLVKGDYARLPDAFKKRNRFMFRPKDAETKEHRTSIKNLMRAGEDVEMPEYSLAPTMINMIGRNPG